MPDLWKPEITTAAVIEKDGLFLLVEEKTNEGIRINQPVGHLEPGESLEEGVIRETLEETAYEFSPTALIGVYMLRFEQSDGSPMGTYLRFAFTGQLGRKLEQPLGPDILRTVWMTRDEIAACPERHRSPLLLQCIDDYLQGQRAPLSLLSHQTTLLGNKDG